MSQEFDNAAKRFVEDKGDSLRPLVKVIPNEEDQVWEEQQHLNDVQARNRAAMAAWNAAGLFVAEHADRLGRLSLREAYERGFLEGWRAGKKD